MFCVCMLYFSRNVRQSSEMQFCVVLLEIWTNIQHPHIATVELQNFLAGLFHTQSLQIRCIHTVQKEYLSSTTIVCRPVTEISTKEFLWG
jgi:hypothetical protein